MTRKWFLFVALLAAPAYAAEDDAAALAALLGSEAEAKGDTDAWLAELLDAVAQNPESPYAVGCLWKIRSLASSATRPETIEARLDPVLAKGVRDGETEEVLRDILANRAKARGDFEHAKSYGGERGYLRRFGVIGPFGDRNKALLHKRFAPEDAQVDHAQPVRAAGRTVSWQELPVHGRSAWVNPQYKIRQGGTGVVYAVARVRPAQPGTIAFKIWCSDGFKLIVNGRTVVVGDRQRHRVPEVVWTTVRLVSGWNRILLKVAGNASFAIKAADPRTGKPYANLEVGEPFGPTGPAARAPAAARTYRTPRERAHPGTPAELAGAAILAQWDGRNWEALKLWERAAADLPAGASAEAANIRAGYGRMLASFSEYPQVHRKLRAREQFELALEHFPHHDSAFARLARYENDDDRPDLAVNQLLKHLAARPTANAAMALANIAKDRGWETEALDAARKALDVSPNDGSAVRFLADYDRRYGNHDALLDRTGRRLRIDRSDWRASDELVKTLLASGREDEAIATLRALWARYPNAVDYGRRIARLLRRREAYDRSLAEWRALEKLVPEDHTHARQIGEILEITGDVEGARAAYRRSLGVKAYQPELWRALSRLEQREFDFARRFEPDVDELLASLPATEELKKKYPKAVAITVLDHSVARVNDDGSAVSFVHMVYKLLDEKGVQKYHDMAKTGETLEIRAILPDGTVMLPTGLARRAYNMEGLIPGTVVDHRFVMFQAASPRGGYDGGQFYFQDYELQRDPNPVLLARLVVITPNDMKLAPVPRNFGGEPKVEKLADATATVWEKRDMPRITAERYMPPVDDIVPYVDYSRPEGFANANWSYLGARRTTWPTPPLEEAASRVVTDGMSEKEKLEALHRFVNKEITGERGTSRYPSAILMEKAGNRAQLFEALVRTVGIAYRTGRAMPWKGVGQDLKQPDPSAFTQRFLWLLPQDAEPIAYFPGPHLAPFGLIPAAYRGSAAYLASEEGGRIIRLPEGGPDLSTSSSFEIFLGADATEARVTGELVYRSLRSYRSKRAYVDTSEDSRRKAAERQLTRYFANPELTRYELPELETPGKPFRIRVEGTMKTYLAAQGDVYVAGLGLPPSGMTAGFVERTERTYDLVLDSQYTNRDEYVIHLGESFVVSRLPESHVVVHAAGTYSLTWRQEGRRVHVRRELHLQPARYTPDEFAGFVAWCKGIDDAEQRKLELRQR
ncbi:MAG: DUF3858 domain-containing protein [Planctomycetota bacterium]|jgi:tetratricopeptide (TPR) repeat protein